MWFPIAIQFPKNSKLKPANNTSACAHTLSASKFLGTLNRPII